MTILKLKAILFLILTIVTSENIKAQTTVENINGKWTFIVDAKPFEVKGVTFGYDNEVDNYEKYFQGKPTVCNPKNKK